MKNKIQLLESTATRSLFSFSTTWYFASAGIEANMVVSLSNANYCQIIASLSVFSLLFLCFLWCRSKHGRILVKFLSFHGNPIEVLLQGNYSVLF
jgi:hypothetical protein